MRQTTFRLTLLLTALFALPAHADFTRTICVRNDADLATAMFLATTDPENSIEDIRIVKGNYIAAGLSLETDTDADDKIIRISGGWSANAAGQCVSQAIDPENTVIDGSGMDFIFEGSNERFEIEGLTFSNFGLFKFQRGYDGAQPWETVTTQFYGARHNIFRNGIKVYIDFYFTEAMAFSNNLIHRVKASQIYSHHGGQRWEFQFNTFRRGDCTPDSGPLIEIGVDEGKMSIQHNIFSSNCPSDLHLNSPQHLSHNLYSVRTGDVPLSNVSPVIAANAGFIDPSAANYRLRESSPVSPAINAGMTQSEANQQAIFFPSRDLDGPTGKRVIGSRVDIGAYESSIDDTPTQWVTSIEDTTDPGTLRHALLSANATPGPATIKFNFGNAPSDCGPGSTIVLSSPLPQITDGVVIDGYSAAHARYNESEVGFDARICVALRGGGAASYGLQVAAGEANADTTLVVKGLRFNDFPFAAVSLAGGKGHTVQGNMFAGDGPPANGRGVHVAGGVEGVVIGGNALQDRNWIVRSMTAGVQLQGAGTYVIGNLIGPGDNGEIDVVMRNEDGIDVGSSGNFILSNTISGNESDGLFVLGANNVVHANVIEGNERGMIVFDSGNDIRNNRIAGNQQQGIAITANAVGNRLRNNVFADNGGLAIDLGNDGTAEWPQVADGSELPGASNGGQNFPELVSASGPGVTGQVAGTLSARKGSYAIEAFASPTCDPLGFGEGAKIVGTGTAQVNTTDGIGSFAFAVADSNNLMGQAITATARSLTTGDTSEMSACRLFTQANAAPNIEAQVIVVPDDSPDGASFALHATDDGLPVPPGKLTFFFPGPVDAPFALSEDGVLTQVGSDPFATVTAYEIAVAVGDGQLTDAATIRIVGAAIFGDGFETAD